MVELAIVKPETNTAEQVADLPPPFSDDAVALYHAEKFANLFRYVALWNRWMHYDGKRWRFDTTLEAYDRIRATCREYSNFEGQTEKASTCLTSGATVAAVEKLCRSDRRLAATVEQWDSEPYFLNTQDGVVYLPTGVISNHYPEHYLTKITAVAPGGECPIWLQFLDRITDGDIELQKFLARMAGYAATGSTRDHALFFCYGNGANGKSVFIKTLSDILNDYAKVAPIETFTATTFERHSTDLAGLRGARLVTANETEEGRQWAESRIKSSTGGDKIAARFMRQDFFEFTPQFKLIIAGNHKPGLRSVDEAIRRRFNLVPFAVTIPAAERDTELTEKLKAEWPGILQWIIDGARDWFDNGICPPECVTRATAEYLDEQDSLTAWLTENCQTGADYRDTAKALFASWVRWATSAGIPAGKRTSFLDGLRKKGLADRRTNLGATFFGIRVAPSMIGGDE
jgi:putative DNA primase/helicase